MSFINDPVARFIALSLVGAIMVLFTLISLKRPWWATVGAIASLPLIPFWAGYSVSVFFVSFHMALLAVAAFAVFLRERPTLRINLADLTVLVVFAITIAGVPLKLTTLSQSYTFFQWMLAYWFARLVVSAYGLRRIIAAISITFCIAAVAILIEFAIGFNLWTRYFTFDNALFARWSNLQSRGGVLRAEGAFGHSIAAGGSLALAAILTLDAKLRTATRVLIVAVMCAAILTTISRIGIITAALGIGMAVVFARTSLSLFSKIATLSVGTLGALVYSLFLVDVFTEAGTEASNSAAYRFWLLDLLPYLEPFGQASSVTRSTAGDLSFGGYLSVDNAVLHFALSNGWVATIILFALMVAATIRVLRLQAGVATVALVATIPALFTVALITQYALVFWLVAGLAASEPSPTRDQRAPDEVAESPSVTDSGRALGVGPRKGD